MGFSARLSELTNDAGFITAAQAAAAAPVQSVNGATGAVDMEQLLTGQTSSISTYPTKCGRYAVYSDIFANMNPDSSYGWLTISGGGSYAEHRFIDSHGNVYFGWGNPSTEPSTWGKLSDNRYKSGDTFTASGAVFAGVIIGAGRQFKFLVPVSKKLTDITTITVSALTGRIAGVAGLVDGATGTSYDWLTSAYTVTASRSNTDYLAYVTIAKTTAFSNATSGTNANIEIGSITLTFS